MTGDTKVVYRSTHPDVLAAVEKYSTEYEGWRDRAKALIADLGFEGRHWIVSDGFHRTVLGVETDGNEVPPRGWRHTVRGGCSVLVPDKRIKAGREAYDRIEDCGPAPDPRDSLPGMPGDYFGPGRLYQPGLQEMAGAVWVVWGYEIPAELVDLAVWERAKLSAFYAAAEERDDAGAVS